MADLLQQEKSKYYGGFRYLQAFVNCSAWSKLKLKPRIKDEH